MEKHVLKLVQEYLKVTYHVDANVVIASSRHASLIPALCYILKSKDIKYKKIKTRVYECICTRHKCKVHVGSCYTAEDHWLKTPYQLVKCNGFQHYEQGFHCEVDDNYCSYGNWQLDYPVKQTQLVVALHYEADIETAAQSFKLQSWRHFFSPADDLRANHIASTVSLLLQEYAQFDIDICLTILSFVGNIKPLVTDKCRNPSTRSLIKYLRKDIVISRPIAFIIKSYCQPRQ